ncbi:MAG: bile acid:sodium symporter family protein [Lentisphaerae bacterium]|nr:bile acid:sodium symporter family protein [Lentisphaerota bacterium]
MIRRFAALMPLWVVALGIVGYLYPPPLVWFKPYLEWMFFGTMLGIGCTMQFSDFRPLVRHPHLVLLGLLAQFIIMPGCGFLIAKALHFPPELFLGMILVGVVPGAMASNVVSYLARTDVAYSIALTSTATLLSPILTPALTYLYAGTVIHIDSWAMCLSILKIVLLPLLIGFSLKHFCPKPVERIHDVFPALSALCIAIICGMVVALNQSRIASLSLVIFLAIFTHNLLGYSGGYVAGKLFRFDRRRRRTLAIEVGMQNAGLGAVLAIAHFSPETALIPAIFATWCVITASLLARYWSRQVPQEVDGN